MEGLPVSSILFCVWIVDHFNKVNMSTFHNLLNWFVYSFLCLLRRLGTGITTSVKWDSQEQRKPGKGIILFLTYYIFMSQPIKNSIKHLAIFLSIIPIIYSTEKGAWHLRLYNCSRNWDLLSDSLGQDHKIWFISWILCPHSHWADSFSPTLNLLALVNE